jgi:hypothetical protein
MAAVAGIQQFGPFLAFRMAGRRLGTRAGEPMPRNVRTTQIGSLPLKEQI